MLSTLLANYRTTFLGVGTILGGIGAALVALFDQDPSTTFSWPLFWVSITTGIGLLRARDDRTSTEQSTGLVPRMQNNDFKNDN